MAHEVENDFMVYTQDVPWHKIGLSLGETDNVSIDNVKERMPILLSPIVPEKVQTVSGFPCDDTFAMVRTFDNKVVGVGGSQLARGLVQPQEIFETLAAILPHLNGAVVHTAAFLREGKQMFATAKLPQVAISGIGGKDVMDRYVFVTTGFDGSLSLCLSQTLVRVVCANTQAAALCSANEKGDLIRIRHTAGMQDRLKFAINKLQNVLSNLDIGVERAQRWANATISDISAINVVNDVLGVKETEVKVAKRTLNTVDKIMDLYFDGTGNSLWKGTAWGLYQGITEFADHHMLVRGGRNQEGLMDNTDSMNKIASSILFGAASDLKTRAIPAIEQAIQMSA